MPGRHTPRAAPLSSFAMTKRRTSGVQRRSRATDAAMNRRVGAGGRSLDVRVVAIVGFLLVGVVAVVLALVSLGPKCSTYCGTRQADEGRQHVANGTTGITYKSNPPTSGTHWETPTEWGVYRAGQPGVYGITLSPSQAIHNLEHGGIVIWYQPDQITPDDLLKLTNFVRTQIGGSRFKYILAPWSGTDFGHPIAVTAWNWRLYLDGANSDAIKQFSDAHYETAPESQSGPGPPAVQ